MFLKIIYIQISSAKMASREDTFEGGQLGTWRAQEGRLKGVRMGIQDQPRDYTSGRVFAGLYATSESSGCSFFPIFTITESHTNAHTNNATEMPHNASRAVHLIRDIGIGIGWIAKPATTHSR